MIRVAGQSLPINVKEEMEQFEWKNPRWKDDRLIACSPFRDETHPSFAVNFENGTWIDSGGEGEFRKGNFISLFAFLRGETYAETEEYLISVYSPHGDPDKLKLTFDLTNDRPKYRAFTTEDLKPFAFRHPYLERRGIPISIQKAFQTGYDPQTKSVVLVWHDKEGNIVNWKHRSVHTKWFWFAKGGQPIKNHLYGIEWVVRRKYREVFITESEIDALTLWAHKIPSVAMGSCYLSDEKRDLLLSVGVKTIAIATDNDEQGETAKRSIIKKCGGLINIKEVAWSGKYKDINDARNEIDRLVVRDSRMFTLL